MGEGDVSIASDLDLARVVQRLHFDRRATGHAEHDGNAAGMADEGIASAVVE